MIKKILLGLLVILVAIQFIHPKRNSSEGPQPNYIGNSYTVPDDVKAILAKACNDCHSNNTRYPWYSKLQPVDWWMNKHVVNGKKHLNFDEFTNRPAKYQKHKLEETIEVVKEGEMPLKSYTWTHKDAKLTTDEKVKITSWAQSVMNNIKAEDQSALNEKRRKGKILILLPHIDSSKKNIRPANAYDKHTAVLTDILFIYKRDSIRHQMKEELEKQLLHTITVKSDAIVWMKPGKEILVQGKMFDIKTAKEENGNTVFSGLYDEEETALNNAFNSGWDKKNSEQNSPLTQFFQLLKGLYTQDVECNKDIFLPTYKFEEPCTPSLVTSFLSILTPPPEVLL